MIKFILGFLFGVFLTPPVLLYGSLLFEHITGIYVG